MSEAETDPKKDRRDHFKFRPWLFFGVLVTPGILSLVVFAFDSRNYGEAAINTWAVSSVIAGIFCGIHFALAQRSMQTGLKIVIGIVSVIGCIGVAAALGMGACSLFVGIFKG